MKTNKSILTTLLTLFLLSFLFFGCNQENSIVDPNNTNDEIETLKKIAEEDELIQSFEANYNEDEAMGFVFGKISTEIFPVKVGQRMRPINFDFNATIEGDSAYGTITRTFEGMLFIIASYDSNASFFDTNLVLIQKPFTTTITRNVIFQRIGNSDNPLDNWKLVAVSLPEGGTLTDNISIKSMTVYLENGDSIYVDSPNDYYLSREPGLRHLIPIFGPSKDVRVKVEIASVYPDPDFVTLTWGAWKDRMLGIRAKHRTKKKFELVSEEFDGTFYNRVYEGNWKVNPFPGVRHAVVNAFPRVVIYDDEAPVESNSWGMPYVVK